MIWVKKLKPERERKSVDIRIYYWHIRTRVEEEDEVTINEREWTIYFILYNLIKLDPIVSHFIALFSF